jgi:hypothetical protein
VFKRYHCNDTLLMRDDSMPRYKQETDPVLDLHLRFRDTDALRLEIATLKRLDWTYFMCLGNPDPLKELASVAPPDCEARVTTDGSLFYINVRPGLSIGFSRESRVTNWKKHILSFPVALRKGLQGKGGVIMWTMPRKLRLGYDQTNHGRMKRKTQQTE